LSHQSFEFEFFASFMLFGTRRSPITWQDNWLLSLIYVGVGGSYNYFERLWWIVKLQRDVIPTLRIGGLHAKHTQLQSYSTMKDIHLKIFYVRSLNLLSFLVDVHNIIDVVESLLGLLFYIIPFIIIEYTKQLTKNKYYNLVVWLCKLLSKALECFKCKFWTFSTVKSKPCKL
jgi:hypothetical protein